MSANSERTEPPKRRRRLLQWCGVLVGLCVVGLATVKLVLPNRFDSTPLMQRLLAAGPKPTAFSAVLPQPDWDTVCYLDPYDKPSVDLPRHLNEDVTNFTFKPFDHVIGEEENGLAFIDHRTRTALIYVVNRIEKRGLAIDQISGPDCLERESAFFGLRQLQRSVDPNLVFLLIE
jgi:hypothetical protein